MIVISALIILVISLWLCQIIDGLPHFLPGLAGFPNWLWLGLGILVLSWLMRDR